MSEKVSSAAQDRRRIFAPGWFDRSRLIVVLLLLMTTAAALVVLMVPDDVEKFRTGQKAARTVTAESDFKWIDEAATEKERNRAEADVPEFFFISQDAGKRLLNIMTVFLEEIRHKVELSAKGLKYYSRGIDPEIRKTVGMLEPEALKEVAAAENLSGALEKVLARGVIQESVKGEFKWGQSVRIKDSVGRIRAESPVREIPTPAQAIKAALDEALARSPLQGKERLTASLAAELANLWKQGNLVRDGEATANAKRIEREKIKPVERRVREGDILFKKGGNIDVLQEKRYDEYQKQFRKAGFIKKSFSMNILKMLMVLFITALCLWSTRRDLVRSNRALSLLTVIVVISILLDKYAIHLFNVFSNSYPDVPSVLVYFSLPVGFGVILVSAFFGMRTALFAGFFITVTAAMHLPEQSRMMLAGFFITACTVSVVKNSGNYRDYFIRSFLGSGGGALIVALVSLLHESTIMELVKKGVLSGDSAGLLALFWMFVLPLASGLLTAILGQMLLYVIELVFDVSTTMSLQIYSDFNHPLLKQLQINAPGTYHHSLMVSTIAEQAAREIGADYVKARVCALFHDVGKLAQPPYFIENSPGIDRHAGIAPSMSAMIILNHVKHGLDLARKYKLKKPMRDAIAQHHGDSVVLFFFKRAEAEAHGKGLTVDPADFRYAGPRPEGKEISIIMLADCCEAASRSLDKLTPRTLEMLVSDIIGKKMRDGQLENSALSMREIAVVRRSIIKTLTSMMHGRIAYPKETKEEEDEDDLFVAAGKAALSASGSEKI